MFCNLQFTFFICHFATTQFWIWKYKFYIEFLYVNFKNIAVHDSIARLKFYKLLCIRTILKTLVLCSFFPFCSICQLFGHIFFYMVICHSVTLYTASKWNRRHNKQKYYGLVINKHSWSKTENIKEYRWNRTLSHAKQLLTQLLYLLLKQLLLTVMLDTEVVVVAIYITA